MEKHLKPGEAWEDFWNWIRRPEQADTWDGISRRERQYLYKADIDHRAGRLGVIRIRTILNKYAPDRYEAVEGFVLKQYDE